MLRDRIVFRNRDDQRRSYVLLRSKLKQAGDALELYRRIVLNAAGCVPSVVKPRGSPK